MSANNYYIGLMSGTSMDGVDGVVVTPNCKTVIGSVYLPYPQSLKTQLKSLVQQGETSLDALAKLDAKVVQVFVQATEKLLTETRLPLKDIKAIGSHGQTIYHQGGEYSMQIGHGALIAEQTGITTVADFRMQDIAAGGQGAPLTPIYHQYLLSDKDGIVVNLGGIANLTQISAGIVSGFDTGPANTLLDNWIKKCRQLDYDKKGFWARSGMVIKPLLADLLADEYFQQPAPKSTGTEYFNLAWLENYLQGDETDVDVQRTLLELSAKSISQNIAKGEKVYLCGGGVHNLLLTERLAELNPNNAIATTHDLDIDPDFVEAAAFAFFAKQTLVGLPSNLPVVTGAKGMRILGAIYAI